MRDWFKKNWLTLLIVAVVVSTAYAAATKFTSLQTGTLKLTPRTLTAINALTLDSAGQLVGCSDCVRTSMCVSSGATTGAFVVPVATGTFVGANYSGLPHCS